MHRKVFSRKKVMLVGNVLAVCAAVFLTVHTVLFLTGKDSPSPLWTAPHGAVVLGAKETYADGKVIVYVGTSRDFGYRIGDTVPVQITVETEDGVRVDFQSLENKTISLNGSDFEIADTPTITTFHRDGKTVYQLDLRLREFLRQTSVTFSADFYYATRILPGGSPDWKPASTPELTIKTANTAAEDDQQLKEGATGFETDHKPLLGYPMLILGALLMLIFPIFTIRRLWRKWFPPEVLPANVIAWRALDAEIADARKSGWQEKHYRGIAEAVRLYLGVESMTLAEIKEALYKDRRYTDIVGALGKCDRVLYSHRPLKDTENDDLLAQLESLVPRPRQEV